MDRGVVKGIQAQIVLDSGNYAEVADEVRIDDKACMDEQGPMLPPGARRGGHPGQFQAPATQILAAGAEGTGHGAEVCREPEPGKDVLKDGAQRDEAVVDPSIMARRREEQAEIQNALMLHHRASAGHSFQ